MHEELPCRPILERRMVVTANRYPLRRTMRWRGRWLRRPIEHFPATWEPVAGENADNMRRGSYVVVGLWMVFVLARSICGQAGANSQGGVLAGTVRLSSGAKADENTVVYLEGITGTYAAPQQPAVLDQNHEMFIPHLVPVQNGQMVKFKNSQTVTHNVHVFRGARTLFNENHFTGQDRDWTPRRPGEYEVRCNIHREMSAYILVFEHPFFASVKHQGSAPAPFTIEGIPPGTYTVVAVRDKKGTLQRQEQKVIINPKQTTTVNLIIPD